MCSCEETSKSQLIEIRNALSKLSSLRAKTIQLRKISQENHVKRMLKARNRGEPLSPVFILPSNSPFREPRRSQIDSPSKPTSPNKTSIGDQEDKQVKSKVVTQKDGVLLKDCASIDRKAASKIKENKISVKSGKLNDSKKNKLKSTLSLRRYSKCEKAKRKEIEKKSSKYKMLKEKFQNKNSEKKVPNFNTPSPPPSISIDLGKGDSVACDKDYEGINSPKEALATGYAKQDNMEENPSNLEDSDHVLSNNSNKQKVDEIRVEDKQNNETVDATLEVGSLKKTLKKKKKVIPRHKTNPFKSQQKDKIPSTSENNGSCSNANKNAMPIKFLGTKTVSPSAVKKDSSILTRSMSLDSLEDKRKILIAKISPVPRNVDKVLNFISDKKSLMASTSLEKGSQIAKVSDDFEKPPMKLYGLSRGPKFPFHEFKKHQNKNSETASEVLGEQLQGKPKIKDKDVTAYGCNETDKAADCTLPITNTLKKEKSAVKNWLKTIPNFIQKNEKTAKKAREIIPTSINFISANSAFETSRKKNSENGDVNLSEKMKQFSPSKKLFNHSPKKKTLQNREPDIATILLPNPALDESEIEDGKCVDAIKNNLGSNSKSPNFKHLTHSKDFLLNPIEKFMNEINFAMNHSDSDDFVTESEA